MGVVRLATVAVVGIGVKVGAGVINVGVAGGSAASGN